MIRNPAPVETRSATVEPLPWYCQMRDLDSTPLSAQTAIQFDSAGIPYVRRRRKRFNAIERWNRLMLLILVSSGLLLWTVLIVRLFGGQ